jgi:hypothetical protein
VIPLIRVLPARFSVFLRALALLTGLIPCLGVPALAQFETRTGTYVGQLFPYSVIVGDFNRDGVPDVAEINTYPAGGVKILLGNGDGTFKLAASYAAGAFPWYGVTASLRRNGTLDLVLNDKLNDSVWVMLGNGDGTFQPPTPYPTTAESYMVALGDFTGAGNLDIAAVEGTSVEGVACDCIEILPGEGNGTFDSPVTTTVPYDILGIALVPGDFNNDGKLDLAVSGEFGSSYLVDVLLGNGDGTFTADGHYEVSATPQSIATAQLTRDKSKLDLVVANYLGNSLSVLLGNGDGTFQDPVSYSTKTPTWVIAQDLDGDGKVDLAVSNAGLLGVVPPNPPGVSVFRGRGDGTFEASEFYPALTKDDVNYVAVADFNLDGKPDLAIVDDDGGEVITLLNTGVIRFHPTRPMDFKEQSVGATSKAQTVTLTNTGTTELKIQSIKASPEFAVTSTCGSSVAAGAKCTISATFSPTKKGAVQGTIRIVDSASSKPQVIELLGTGT